MNKRIKKKLNCKSYWRIISDKNFKVGGLTHDCDGFNHRISKIIIHRDKRPDRRFVIKDIDVFVVKNGIEMTTCPCCFSPYKPPESKESILNWVRSYDCESGLKIIENWSFNDLLAHLIKLRNGEEIVDDNGVLL